MTNQFCKDTGIKIDDPMLRLRMTEHKYGFVNVSPKNISRALKELRIMNNVATEGDKEDIGLELYGIDKDYDVYLNESVKELCFFIQNCHGIDPEEVPHNVSNLLKNHL
jgi:hypothetical protein